MSSKGKKKSKDRSDKDKKKGEEAPQEKKKKEIKVEVSSDYDIDELSQYSGHTRIERLLFVGQRCPKHSIEAFKRALDYLKQTQYTNIYRKTFDKLGEKNITEFQLDSNWADSTDKKAQQQLEKLEHDLETAKTSLIKESIRVGNIELGNFFYNRGDLNPALRCYVRARDYCTSGEHIIDMCMNVIKVSIELGNFAHVLNYVSKAEQIPELKDKVTIAKLKVCAGLSHLENRKYKQAAKKFIETSFAIGDHFADIILPKDIAIYGGLCALATYERSQLKKQVIDNGKFKSFLELVPALHNLIRDFYNSKYATFLENLEKFRLDLQLDIHLHDHIKGLYEKIRNKSIVQYFSPFVSVDMKMMAEAFKTDVLSLEKELSRLIMENVIQARIDSHNKRLYAKKTDERTSAFEQALGMGKDFELHTRSLLLRVNLIKNDFLVKPPRSEKERGEGRHRGKKA